MVRCRPFAHAASTREADLPVKFHAENTPRPPCKQKGPKWQSFTLPAARQSRHFRGSLLHCRSHSQLVDGGKNGARHRTGDRGLGELEGVQCEGKSVLFVALYGGCDGRLDAACDRAVAPAESGTFPDYMKSVM